ncbi:MAG: hypothetical protein K2O76_05650 [Mailhella sp.]|jgi:hypothetical protein|nr:hypothetical protein [Mailhella sp.]
MEKQELAGCYGEYELIAATEETVGKYFEDCLDVICQDEIYEAWQLYRISAGKLLENVLEHAFKGEGEAYFLVFHDREKGGRVIGLGGLAPLNDMGKSVGEIWFAGGYLTKHKRFLVRHGREIIAKALTHYPILVNIAASWNNQTFSLVRYLGFFVEEDYIRAGLSRALFKRFYTVRNPVCVYQAQ